MAGGLTLAGAVLIAALLKLKEATEPYNQVIHALLIQSVIILVGMLFYAGSAVIQRLYGWAFVGIVGAMLYLALMIVTLRLLYPLENTIEECDC